MILYHYTSGAGLFGILDSKQLHCSHQKFLNDPTEQSYFDELVKETIKGDEKLDVIFDSFSSPNSTTYDKFFPPEQYIFSCCKNPDSLSMWNHYGKGNGYNIGLDIETLVKRKVERDLLTRVEMVYDRKLQKEAIHALIVKHEDNLDRFNVLLNKLDTTQGTEQDFVFHDLNQLIVDFNTELYELKIQFKHEAYQEEEEVRIIMRAGNSKLFKVSEQGIFVQYNTIDILPNKDITSITTHPLSSDLHAEGLHQFLDAKMGRDHSIEVEKSEIPLRMI